jgi:hypothetical protein
MDTGWWRVRGWWVVGVRRGWLRQASDAQPQHRCRLQCQSMYHAGYNTSQPDRCHREFNLVQPDDLMELQQVRHETRSTIARVEICSRHPPMRPVGPYPTSRSPIPKGTGQATAGWSRRLAASCTCVPANPSHLPLTSCSCIFLFFPLTRQSLKNDIGAESWPVRHPSIAPKRLLNIPLNAFDLESCPFHSAISLPTV